MKLIKKVNNYMQSMNLCDMGLLKICLLSLGMMLGLTVNKKYKKPCLIALAIAFVATYVPVMTKFIGYMIKKSEI